MGRLFINMLVLLSSVVLSTSAFAQQGDAVTNCKKWGVQKSGLPKEYVSAQIVGHPSDKLVQDPSQFWLVTVTLSTSQGKMAMACVTDYNGSTIVMFGRINSAPPPPQPQPDPTTALPSDGNDESGVDAPDDGNSADAAGAPGYAPRHR